MHVCPIGWDISQLYPIYSCDIRSSAATLALPWSWAITRISHLYLNITISCSPALLYFVYVLSCYIWLYVLCICFRTSSSGPLPLLMWHTSCGIYTSPVRVLKSRNCCGWKWAPVKCGYQILYVASYPDPLINCMGVERACYPLFCWHHTSVRCLL